MIDKLVEVTLEKQDDFLKVRETLTRIGVAAKKENILYQSCHILHKQGKYYIVHFKELFELDGKPSDMSDNDIQRRNTIANLMAEWGLVKLVDPSPVAEDNTAPGFPVPVPAAGPVGPATPAGPVGPREPMV